VAGTEKTTPLPTLRLGRTDMDITRVGFGAWAVGGGGWAFAWGDQDDRESIAAIRHAIERGINWIDTAAVYGLGHSEEVVRQALAPIPASERPYVFTKCGLVWDDNDRKAPARRIGGSASLRRDLEASLRRLGVERIDLFQMHGPPNDGAPIDEYWQTLLDMKKEGKVRAVGLSNHNASQVAAAERLGHVDTLQPPFSAIRRGIAEAELPLCLAQGTGVIVYSPMQSGLLTGRFTAERAGSLSSGDWRSRNPEFTGDNLARNLKLAKALEPIAARHQTTVATVAVSWTLAWPGVTGAIVGARDPAQVDGWLDAATLHLSKQDLADIAASIESCGAGSGPISPLRA